MGRSKQITTDLATVKPVSASLAELTMEFQALLDTQEMVPPELQEAFNHELARAAQQHSAKVDRVAQYIRHKQSLVAFLDGEIDTYTAKKAIEQNAIDRLKSLSKTVIESLGYDQTGAYPKLRGNVNTIRLHPNSDSVDITDEQRVPRKYKTVTVKMSAETWDSVTQQIPSLLVDTVCSKVVLETSRDAILRDLKADPTLEIPGADLKLNQYHVRID